MTKELTKASVRRLLGTDEDDEIPQGASEPVQPALQRQTQRRKHFLEGTTVVVRDINMSNANEAHNCARQVTCSNGQWSASLDDVVDSCHVLECSAADFQDGCSNGTISGEFGNCVCTPLPTPETNASQPGPDLSGPDNSNNDNPQDDTSDNNTDSQNNAEGASSPSVAVQSSLGGGAIAGIAVGGTALVGIIAAGLWMYLGQSVASAAAPGVLNAATGVVASGAANAAPVAAASNPVLPEPTMAENGPNSV